MILLFVSLTSYVKLAISVISINSWMILMDLDSDDSFVCILDQIRQARYICQIHQFLDDIDGFGL